MNKLLEQLGDREDIKAMNDYIDKIWALLPDLCNAVQKNFTVQKEEGLYTPDRSTVAYMLKEKDDNYVRATLDVILEELDK